MLAKCLLLTVKLYTIIFLIMYKHCDGFQFFTTVEPPRKGHFGEVAYVPCREVVPISEVCLFFIVSP